MNIKYQNPVATKGDFADPFVLRYNGKYYLYCTNPDIRCWSSDDLLEWKLEGQTIMEDTFPELVPFAPEVVYSNGKFYMYTSPSGFGHYILESESPKGPFRKISDNVHHAIDGTIFIDDDGKWYFYWAGDEGIWGCEMKSPTEFGEPVLTGATMYGWTEGPLVCKVDGIYYMTYTGNHYLSKGYRINAAWSTHPLKGYIDDAYNPILIHTQGEVVGLGHSSTVIGPDLTSHYIVYHNMNEDASRDLDIDRQLWYKNVTQILGPTRTPQPAPSMPDYAFPTNKTNALEFNFKEGNWQWENGVYYSNTDDFFVTSKQKFSSCFSSEFHMIIPNDSCNGKRGIVFAETKTKYYSIEFDIASNSVQLWWHDQTYNKLIEQSSLIKDYMFDALHCIRVERKNTGLITIYIDHRLQFQVSGIDLIPVSIGYFSDYGIIGCGYTAITESTVEEAVGMAIPVECSFYPVFGKGTFRKNSDGSILIEEGRTAEYNLLVEDDARYSFFITCCSSEDYAEIDIMIDNKKIGDCTGEQGIENFQIDLSQGNHSLRLFGKTGALLVKRIQSIRVQNNDDFEDVKVPMEVGLNGKKLFGEVEWSNYEVSALFRADLQSKESNAGLLIRVTEPSEGGEGTDTVLGIHFFIGYSISFSEKELVIARHRYDKKILSKCAYDFKSNQIYELCVKVYGSEIRVYVNNEITPQLVVNDPEPIAHGKAGIWAKDSIATIKKISIQK